MRRRQDHPSAAGGKWIRPNKRLAIYLRDRFTCVWCGTSITEEHNLTIDHVVPHHGGGDNEATNLATCCRDCNGWRADTTAEAFAELVFRQYQRERPEKILARVRAACRTPLRGYRSRASTILRRGGSVRFLLAQKKARGG